MALQPGTKAPSFRLPSTTGEEISLDDFRGKKVVLYFYPKDSTPGCTQEACDFRDNDAAVQQAGAVVLGVSKDSLASHEKFRSKYELPFPLLTDRESEVAAAYGAYGEKMMYGKPVVGTIRSTFLIDENGVIERTWSPVKVAGHVEQVLAALRGEEAPAPAPKRAGAKKADNPAAATASARALAGGRTPQPSEEAPAHGGITEKTAKGARSKAAKEVAESQAEAATRAPREVPKADPTGRSKLPSTD